jgi:polar amino acid transport system substrate-binding protein
MARQRRGPGVGGRVAAVLLSAFAWTAATADEAPGTPLRVLTGEWPPHVSTFASWPGGTRDDAHGLATEILAIALRQCDLEAQFEFHPWDRVLDLAERGQAMAFPFRHSPQRARRFVFSEPLLYSREHLFFNPTRAPRLADATSVDALAGTRIAFVKGYEYAPAFAALRDAGGVELDDEREAFARLVDGRVDAVIADRQVGRFLLDTFFPDAGRVVEVNRSIHAETALRVAVPREFRAGVRHVLPCLNERFAYLVRNAAQRRIARQLALDVDPGFHVTLDGPSDYPVAVGTQTVDGEGGFLIPRGTRALVLTWDTAFVSEQRVEDRRLMYRKSEVKLLDGPLRGRVLWVPNLFLRY